MFFGFHLSSQRYRTGKPRTASSNSIGTILSLSPISLYKRKASWSNCTMKGEQVTIMAASISLTSTFALLNASLVVLTTTCGSLNTSGAQLLDFYTQYFLYHFAI